MAQVVSDVAYVNNECKKMILTSRKHVQNLQRANKHKLAITSVGGAGNFISTHLRRAKTWVGTASWVGTAQ